MKKGVLGFCIGLLVLVTGANAVQADFSVSGTVRFFVDGDGRAVVVVDDASSGSPDGYADHVFLLAKGTAINSQVDVTFSGATVQFSGNRVLVNTSNNSIHVDLAIGSPSAVGNATTVYRFIDGVELVDYPLANDTTMASFGTGSFSSGLIIGWICPVPGGGTGCDSGGPGASGCNNGGQNGCGVTCREGYYACCRQSGNHCTCVAE